MTSITPTTLYWDDTTKNFVLIVNTPPRVRHHKIPKSCHTEDEAIAYIDSEGLLNLKP